MTKGISLSQSQRRKLLVLFLSSPLAFGRMHYVLAGGKDSKQIGLGLFVERLDCTIGLKDCHRVAIDVQ